MPEPPRLVLTKFTIAAMAKALVRMYEGRDDLPSRRCFELRDHFDFVASREDVENPKPHPEVYLLVASELNVPPGECLVIEDSPTGVRAAQAAGMDVIAVTTPFTLPAFRESELLDRRWVVDEPSELPRH